jgi:hypothetical protein
MTRKDYERAAQMLREYREHDGDASVAGVEPFVKFAEGFLCRFFREDNPRFSEDRFRQACKPKKGEVR